MNKLPRRKLYKFSSSVSQGGFLYSHKTLDGQEITNKYGLKNALLAIAKQLELIDVTIKVYDNIFFMFYMTKPMVKPIELIEKIQATILQFGKWDEQYIYTGTYDLQKEYVRRDLEKMGFKYDKG